MGLEALRLSMRLSLDLWLVSNLLVLCQLLYERKTLHLGNAVAKFAEFDSQIILFPDLNSPPGLSGNEGLRKGMGGDPPCLTLHVRKTC